MHIVDDHEHYIWWTRGDLPREQRQSDQYGSNGGGLVFRW